MKIILAILSLSAAGFGGWHFYPTIHKDMQETIAARAKDEAKAEQDRKNGERDTASARTDAMLARIASAAGGGGEKSVPNPALNNTAGGNSSAPPAPAPVTTTAPVDEIEARYPIPTFKTVEEITKDWTSIPSRAFPRPVTTKVPITFELGNGSAVLPAGSKARALAMVGGLLVLSRENDENSRVQVPLANTDLKEFLTAKYEEWKNYRRDMIIKQRERARKLIATANGASAEQMAAAGPKPEVRPGGVIPVMLSDLETRKLVELKASAITSWGGLNFEEVDGKHYWTGTVQCTVENALFGPQPTEVMALIRDNTVVKWMYTGSREEVQ